MKIYFGDFVRRPSLPTTECWHFSDTIVKDAGLEMEKSSKGKVEGSVSWTYFTAGAHPCLLIFMALLFLFVQTFVSGTDYWISMWWVIYYTWRMYIDLYFEIIFFSRVKQEKLRTAQKSNNSNWTNESHPSYTFTTEQCIYINGALLGGIFVFGVIRWNIAAKKFGCDFYSVFVSGHLDSIRFALTHPKISTSPCSTGLFQRKCDSLIQIHRDEFWIVSPKTSGGLRSTAAVQSKFLIFCWS